MGDTEAVQRAETMQMSSTPTLFLDAWTFLFPAWLPLGPRISAVILHLAVCFNFLRWRLTSCLDQYTKCMCMGHLGASRSSHDCRYRMPLHFSDYQANRQSYLYVSSLLCSTTVSLHASMFPCSYAPGTAVHPTLRPLDNLTAFRYPSHSIAY